MKFKIIPYVGAFPITFGMSEVEVTALLGEPRFRTETFDGRVSHNYETVNVGYSEGRKVNHIGFLPGSDVELEGVDPFGPSGFERLVAMDGEPMEVLGAVVFLKLGIATDGFVTGDEGDKGVSVFVRGEYDNLKHRMKPFTMRHTSL